MVTKSVFLLLFLAALCRAQGVGENCDSNGKCVGDGVICGADQKCICHERLWFDGTNCVSALDADCNSVSAACAVIPFALCETTSNFCKCLQSYTPALDSSVSASANVVCAAAQIGDFCLEAQQCASVPNSECSSESRCDCKSGYVPDEDPTKGCVPALTLIGETCKNSMQCKAIDENAECIDKKCACAEFFFVNSLKSECLPARFKIGDPCEAIEQCTTELGSEALCSPSNKTCVCKDSTVASKDGNTCLPIVPLEGVCLQEQQCTQNNEGSECKEFTCTCKEEYEVVNGKCFKTPDLLGDPCTNEEQCDKFGADVARCFEQKCQCNDGYVPNSQLTGCLKGVGTIGSPCTDSAQCSSISNSNCDIFSQKCICNDGHVPSAANTDCLPQTSGITGECSDLGQCTAAVGGEVDCIDEVCLCKENCHFIYNDCWNSKRLFETCVDSRECLLADNIERAECKNSTCLCKEGFTADRISNTCNSGFLVTGSVVTLSLLLLVTQKEWILSFF
ncbi:Hypothetical predicted protein [Cloeon dipterum]|uniref:EB domain-containing protein n=1 Tax=Cloeon dipterum TaxID=197152 RepID=A0A8S1C0R6_9INSE|nr:Hypothetical predicted protein [Cloeon dipterum]